MAETTMTVFMKETPPNTRFSLYRNGKPYGGSIRREGILSVLLSSVRTSAGYYQVRRDDTNEVVLTYDTDQPAWSGTTIEKHVSKMPGSPRHEYRAAAFSCADEPTEDNTFRGYHDGGRWNGWAQPWLEQSEVERVVAMLEAESDDYTCEFKYGQLIMTCHNSEDTQVISPTTIVVDNEKKTVYPMALGWIWDVVD